MRTRQLSDMGRRGLCALMTATMLGDGSVAVAAEKETGRPPSVWEQETFSSEWHGLRTALCNHDVELTIQYINEGLRVLSGGIYSRGNEGRLEFTSDVNFEKFMGWRGASAHVTLINIHDCGWNVAQNVRGLAEAQRH